MLKLNVLYVIKYLWSNWSFYIKKAINIAVIIKSIILKELKCSYLSEENCKWKLFWTDLLSYTAVFDTCQDTACFNGGTCIEHETGINCTCPEGFMGQFCHEGKSAIPFVTHIPPVEDLGKNITGGVSIVRGWASWIFPHEICAPSVVKLTKMLHRGCVVFIWHCLISYSIRKS